MKTIGKIIKSKRIEKGLSVQKVAKKLKTHRQNVYNWEEDVCYPHIFTFCDMADIFECSLDELCGRVKQ
jgi:transcriptional regulator with XRE-family HTH domain